MDQTLVTTWEDDVDAAKLAMSASAFSAIEAGKLWNQARGKHRAVYGGTGWEQAVEEHGVSVRTVNSFINVYEKLGENRNIDVQNMTPTVMRRIAAPSVPPEAIVSVVERVQAGEKVTVKVTEEIIAQAKADARAEQLKRDREEIAVVLARVENLEATLTRVTTDRRVAEKQVEELEGRIAAGPSQRLKEELQDAQDELYKEKKRVDGLSTDLISAKAETRRLEVVMRTSDDNVAARQALMSAVRRAITALQDVTYQDASNVHLQRGDRGVLDSLGVEIEKAGQFLEQFSQVVEAD